MPAFRSSRLERKSRRRSLSSLKRFAFQTLEHRFVLSAAAWTGASGGSWDVGSNWSTGSVPAAGDDVTIDTSSAMTITIQSGESITVNSLTTGANDTLSLTGASVATKGDFTNNGTLTVDAGSKVSVDANFSQSSTGSLNVQIGGSSASGRFGEVAVQDAATLAGALNLSLASGYTPQTGDDFQVMTFSNVIGNFASVTGLGTSLTEKLQPTSVDLLGPPLDVVQSPLGTSINATIGDGFYDTVATFADSNPSAQAGQFVAAIDWGDGTTSNGNVGTNGGQFQAQGFHDYAHSGTFTVTTTIVDHGVAMVVTSTAVVLPWGNDGKIHVTTSADTHAANPANSPVDSSGNISLRSAIEYLNAQAYPIETIDFDGNYFRGPLQLTLGAIEIDASVQIDGSGVYQLNIAQATTGTALFFQIDKVDKNNQPVSLELSNLTLDLGVLAPNNTAPIENLGGLTLDNNFASSIAYSPVSGDTAAFVSGGGALDGSPRINGAVVNPSYANPSFDVGLSGLGDVYPFKVDRSSGGLVLTFDTNPTLGVFGSTSPSGNYVTVGQSAPVPASDVVADWRFQEGTAGQPAAGSIADSSGHGLDGTPINSPVYSSNVPYGTVPQTGQPDNVSLQFNGTNQQIVVPDNPALELTHSLTIEAVVYVPAATQFTYGFVLFRGDYRPGLDPYTLNIAGLGANFSANFNIEDASNNSAGVSAPLPGVNQWLDIVGTLDDATGAMRLYINGVELASTVTSVRPLGPLDPTETPGLGIGNFQSTNQSGYFMGLMNEVRICNVALTPDQFLGSTPGNFVVTDNGVALINEPASNLNSLNLDGTKSDDTFDVTPSLSVPINVEGSDSYPGPAPSDTLVLPQWGTVTAQSFDPLDGYGGLWRNVGDQPVFYTAMKSVELKHEPAPTSSVTSLPAATPTTFSVSWSGSDIGGPGIRAYDVFVSDNGGPFTAWQTETTQTTATWQGRLGHTYGFYSVAIDAEGQSQPTPTNAQMTTQVIVGEPNANYVTAVYQDVLARTPDPGGLAYWTDLLNQGTAIASVAEAIAHSDEYYAHFVVMPDYLNLLGRAPDANGLTYWTSRMDMGLTDQQLEANLVSSDEFFQAAGGTNATWIDAVYKLLLGRAGDASGESFWLKQLSGGATLLSVAQDIANSQENDAQLIKNDYFHYLGRSADDAGLAYWLTQFADGETNEDVIAGFTGSAEYYTEHDS